MNVLETLTEAYERWDAGDIDGFLGLFTDDAIFVVPGETGISGDHDKTSFRRVLELIGAATREGRHSQAMVCTYASDTGAIDVLDNFAARRSIDTKYHTVHEWIFGDNGPRVMMWYVHEYDAFDRARPK